MTPNQQIEVWLNANRSGFSAVDRPWVTLCYAQSVDGSIALRPGEPLALSCPESLELTHQLRGSHDGILVGINTVLSDDPQLNVRHCAGRDPQPIVLDSHLRMPAGARLCQLPNKHCWLLTTYEATDSTPQETTLDAVAGLDIFPLDSDSEGRVSLPHAMRLLRAKGITSLMVEGGASVITAFLQARLADALVATLVPQLVGGLRSVNELGHSAPSHLPTIAPLHSATVGRDLVLWGNLCYATAG